MPRKPKHSGDNPATDDEVIIEGTAERIHDDMTDKASPSDEPETKAKARPTRLAWRRLGRFLWLVILFLGIVAGLAAAGLSLSNRLLITQQQDASAAQDINSRTILIETALAALDGELASLRDAVQQSQNTQGDNAELLDDIPSRLSLIEDQVARLDEIITQTQDQPAARPSPDADPDIMILAQQLAEMDQRILELEAQLRSYSADPDRDDEASAPKDTDQNTGENTGEDTASSTAPITNSPAELSVLSDAIINAARQGQGFANLLPSAINADTRWETLKPWSENPPPAHDDLWRELTAQGDMVFADSPSPDPAPEESDSSWWSWLTSPLSEAVTIAPIDPASEAKAQFVAALEQRDHMAAIAALTTWSDETNDISAWAAAWQMQFDQRQDLDQAIANLIITLGK
jgi:hypothetical protein